MIPFESEQWMTRFEKNVECNLADTSVPALSLKDLETNFQDLFLDYGNIDGSQRVCELIESLYDPGTENRQVLPTLGSSQANFLILENLLEPGDEIIVFSPDYKQFERVGAKFGCTVKSIPLDLDGQFDPEELEQAITDKSRLIAFSSPNNPMGTVFDEAHRNHLIELAEKNGLWILSDEVYRLDELSYSDLSERAVSSGSLSKIFGAAGLRFGWIRAHEDLINKIRYEKDYHFISTGPFVEKLAEEILQRQDELKDRARNHLDRNRKIFENWLKSNPQFKASFPDSGNSVLIHLPQKEDEAFCERLAGQGILLVPGSFFGTGGTARLGFGAQPDFFEKGLQKLEKKLSDFSPNDSQGMI